MKRLFLLITIFTFILSSAVFASENALDKGAVRIGGSMSFQRFTGDAYSDVTIFNFTPSASYAVNNGSTFTKRAGLRYNRAPLSMDR